MKGHLNPTSSLDCEAEGFMKLWLSGAYPNTFLNFYSGFADTEFAEKYCSKFSTFISLRDNLHRLTVARR